MERLWGREPEIEAMSLSERLEYLQAVAEAKGKIELLQVIKDYYDTMALWEVSEHYGLGPRGRGLPRPRKPR